MIALEFDNQTIADLGLTPTGEYEARQVFGIKIERRVTEYRAQIYVDQQGKKHVAPFPKEARSYSCYSTEVREFAVNLSVNQMVPYERTTQFIQDVFQYNISEGALRSFIHEAYDFVEQNFIPWAKIQLILSDVAFFDETPINVDGHYASAIAVTNGQITVVEAYPNRKIESLIQMGILPYFMGVAMSDSYLGTLHFQDCIHVLCTCHLRRELKGVHEKEGMHWAELMLNFFRDLTKRVDEAGCQIEFDEYKKFIKRFNNIITRGESEIEDKKEAKKVSSNSKTLPLLKRLVKRFVEYTLFALFAGIPNNNNAAERALRMHKVPLKISGCFKNVETANEVTTLYSYIDTCRHYGMSPHEALSCAFNKRLPDFVDLDQCDQDLLENVSKEQKINRNKVNMSNDYNCSNETFDDSCQEESTLSENNTKRSLFSSMKECTNDTIKDRIKNIIKDRVKILKNDVMDMFLRLGCIAF